MPEAFARLAVALSLALQPTMTDAEGSVTLIDHEVIDQTGAKRRFVSDATGDKKAVIAGI